jgi:hypothetical protein
MADRQVSVVARVVHLFDLSDIRFVEEPDMGQTASKAQRARASERDARLERARQRRLALDEDRAAREARIDAAVADVYQAQDDRQEAARASELAERRIGEAINRILGEGVPLAQVAELTELSVTQVQRLKAAAAANATPSAEPGADDARAQLGAATPRADAGVPTRAAAAS